VKLAQAMYEETEDDGRRRYTVAAVAAEFGVTPPTVYRHLTKPGPAGALVHASGEDPTRK
jgi:predicted transcriptional regulator